MDLAQNFFEEPTSEEYIQAKKKLRSNVIPTELDARIDGIKLEEVENEDCFQEPEDSNSLADDSPCKTQDIEKENALNGYNSEEDWDSDSYWEPDMYRPRSPTPPLARWNAFVRQKVREGNFCPFLDHATPIMEQIKNKIKPIIYEEGQCDSLSEDEEDN
ncbi:hypothetical protein EVAR_79227_1 [Eumeta japonica]|uniref:Uncharacterized protein n=1 Tax=Eumeta variegata TaxID=151549 RepID=A0A4C1ZBY9_EUMVA|nr:hypothetical protein EVAR_79227_1 [Eumeta japonica]